MVLLMLDDYRRNKRSNKMGDDYKVIENKLLINGITVSFSHKIMQIEYLDGIYIVMLGYFGDNAEIDNIYGVDKCGKLVWKIENAAKVFNKDKNSQGYMYYAKSTYCGFNINKDGTISAFTYMSMCFIVDCKTGKLLDERQAQ